MTSKHTESIKDEESKIEEYSIALEEAIIKCWETYDLDYLNKFINEYCEKKLIKKWNKSCFDVKIMTLCKMTLGIISGDVTKYHKRALNILNEIREEYENE